MDISEDRGTTLRRGALVGYKALSAVSGVIITHPTRLFGLFVQAGAGTSARYIQLFNAVAVPADTAVPDFAPIYLAAGPSGIVSLDFGRYGYYFSVGLSWCISSTDATKTVAADQVHVSAQISPGIPVQDF